MDPVSILTAASLAFNLWQAWKNRNAREAVGALTESIETAAANGRNPKAIARLKLAGAALRVVNDELDKRDLRKGSSK